MKVHAHNHKRVSNSPHPLLSDKTAPLTERNGPRVPRGVPHKLEGGGTNDFSPQLMQPGLVRGVSQKETIWDLKI